MLSWCAARTASASCEVALDGDPEIVDDIQAALFTFGRDEVPCVTVRALCSRDASDLVIDLRDQLGRSVQRRFTTAVGAAAFLISWSRRPLPDDGTELAFRRAAPPSSGPRGAGPAAAPPGADRAALTAPPSAGTNQAAPATPPPASAAAISPPGLTQTVAASDAPAPPMTGLVATDGWHPELRGAYLLGLSGPGGLVEGALIRHRGIWHYGPDLRVFALPPGPSPTLYEGVNNSIIVGVAMWLAAEAELTAGVRWAFDRLVVRADVAAGAAYVTLMSGSHTWHFQTLAGHAGARLSVASQLVSSLWLEAGAGVDTLLTSNAASDLNYVLGSDRLLTRGHVEVGLVWAR